MTEHREPRTATRAPDTGAERIDALRKAIDAAVDGLNEAWGGFGPTEALEAVIGGLQRARTADDIAQGRDWPPVVVPDSGAEERLRAALDGLPWLDVTLEDGTGGGQMVDRHAMLDIVDRFLSGGSVDEEGPNG